ncbi:hypothetical protein [Desulfatirhabdium butyrativorans]|uniref:hypothetical protein n=1 Tax=Desulfatirhabdium butyrativorans TaxID=340467 RepID=UPI0004232EE5|nr:hypothetical protein [Desulfatirhabdium butyrativorans]
MVGWTIFLILLWIIWFCAAKRWVYPRKRTETDILIQAFNELSKEDAKTDALNDTEKGHPR